MNETEMMKWIPVIKEDLVDAGKTQADITVRKTRIIKLFIGK